MDWKIFFLKFLNRPMQREGDFGGRKYFFENSMADFLPLRIDRCLLEKNLVTFSDVWNQVG